MKHILLTPALAMVSLWALTTSAALQNDLGINEEHMPYIAAGTVKNY